MDYKVDVLLDQFQKVLDNKLALMQFRFANACVKADPASLLSVRVDCDSMVMNIEDACDVVKKDEDKFFLIPQDDSYLEPIADAVDAEHPEFGQQVVEMKLSADNDTTVMTLLLTVPPVDKNRHDILVAAVDGYKDVFEKSVEKDKAMLLVQIAPRLIGLSKEEADEVNEIINKGVDEKKEKAGQLADEKKKEIDEAYQRYQESQASSDGLDPESLKADAEAATSMKME